MSGEKARCAWTGILQIVYPLPVDHIVKYMYRYTVSFCQKEYVLILSLVELHQTSEDLTLQMVGNVVWAKSRVIVSL